ncbi:MAG: NAD(P)-binding protein [Chloroflexi bacterium]|nr:NAD(P)-binding protein [Chloroflexota bacterium]
MAAEDRVLIAGAGPAGLSAAAFLVEAGIPVTVFEAEQSLPIDPRASTFHPPTLDMLDELGGVTEQVIEQGLIAPTWQYRDRRTGPIATFDLSILDGLTAHPYRVQTEQWKFTQILLDRLLGRGGCEVRFGEQVIGANQDGSGVSALIRFEGVQERSERGRYLIGADGAASLVRISQGIEFQGLTFPELFLVLTTPFDFREEIDDLSFVNYLSDPEEWLVLLRTRYFWRVLFPAPEDEEDSDLTGDSSVQRRMQSVLPRREPYEVTHRSLYRVHQRVAERYRLGRILLAGDAAHVNNPLGGMGMNGSVHDAVNLAKKLIAIWGGADDSLLDVYERQRRTVCIEHVQAATLRNRELLRESDPELRRERQEEWRRTAEVPEAALAFLRNSSMIASLERERELA